MAEEEKDDSMPQNSSAPVSFAEFAAAMKSLQPPPVSSSDTGIAKHLQTIVVAAALGIGGFVLTSLNSVQTSLATLTQTASDTQKTVDQISRRQDEAASQIAQMSANVATLNSRVTSLEARADRMEHKGSAP